MGDSAVFYVLLGIIALSFLFISITFFWIARTLAFSTNSVRRLVEDVDSRLKENLDSLDASLKNVNRMTERAGAYMDRVDVIVGNLEHATGDARTSLHLVESTIAPLFANLHSIIMGVRRGVETWYATAPGLKEERRAAAE
ncbi:MAG: DUF948 domain-containing protein [bacterium]